MWNRLRETLSASWRGMRRHPGWATLGAVGVGGVFDWLERFRSGAGLMERWLGPHWLAITVGSPYFKLLALTVGLFAFWRIGLLSLRAERAHTEAALELQTKLACDAAARGADEGAAVKAALELSIRFAKFAVHDLDIQSLRHYASIFEGSVRQYRQEIERFLQNEPFLFDRHRDRLPDTSHFPILTPFQTVAVPSWSPDFHRLEPNWEFGPPTGPFNKAPTIYSGGKNEDFKNSLRYNLTLSQKRHAQLVEVAANEEAVYRQQRDQLIKDLATYKIVG